MLVALLGVGSLAAAIAWALWQRALGRRGVVRARVESDGATLEVRDLGGHRELVVRGADTMVHTRIALDDTLVSGWAYTDACHLAPLVAPSATRALFVGAGGGILPRQFVALHPRLDVEVVEIDPRVVALARAHFGLEGHARLRVEVGDGWDHVARARPGTWDVVIVDAYVACRLPPRLASRAFFASIRERLREGGVVGVNVVGRLDGGLVPRVAAALGEAFGDEACLVVPVTDPRRERADCPDRAATRNVVLFATRGAMPSAALLAERARHYDASRLPHLHRALAAARPVLLGRAA